MIITEKNTTREHISQEHMNTQQRENASKRHEHTPKGKHNWNWVVFLIFHVHRFSYIWGFLPQKEAKRKEARAHVTCTKTRRKKKLDTHENRRKNNHTWTHIEKTHEHTTKGKHIQKAWKHTKRETQLKEFCLSFSLVFLHVGISRKEARAHVICTNRRRKKKLDTHENHRRKTPTHENILKSHTNTQQKKKTHFKGMKTHQKGNTLESDLSFIFVGFLTFWISPTNRGKAQRGESTCHLLNGPSNVFDVCSEIFFSEHTSKTLGGPSSRWHVLKWQGVRGCFEQMTCT